MPAIVNEFYFWGRTVKTVHAGNRYLEENFGAFVGYRGDEVFNDLLLSIDSRSFSHEFHKVNRMQFATELQLSSLMK